MIDYSDYNEDDDFGSKKISSASKPNKRAAASAMAKSAGAGGSAVDIGSSGMIASGNPAAMGVGLGIKVLSSARAKKEAEKKQAKLDKEKNRLDRVQKQDTALARLIGVTNGLRNL